jgi:1-aminocyclopropane-1-carboxylate deaminase/D-cysteine desulfhydrase-like pyridoxal-dependent ACC family enzyme
MADVLHQEADCIVTWAGVQSNWCRQLAAAAKKFKIKPILLLFKRPPFSKEYDGNLLLDFILDAEIRIIEIDRKQKIMELKDIKEIVESVAYEQKKLEKIFILLQLVVLC